MRACCGIKFFVAYLLVSLTLGLSHPASAKDAQEDDALRINLVVSVAWHGNHIFPHNLIAMRNIRQQFPNLKFHHFISPNYFLIDDEKERRRRTQMIRAMLSESDEIGLFLEARPAIVEPSGVLFRNRPTFFGGDDILCDQPRACEQDALLSVYSRDELIKIFNFSLRVLRSNGFEAGNSWMSRYWEGDPQITQAAIRSGFQQDFSAIPPSRVQRRLTHSPGFAWLNTAWSQLDDNIAQPYTRKLGRGQVLIVPQSIGVIDYQTPNEALARVEGLIQKSRANKRKDLVLHLVFNQETTDNMHARLVTTLRGIQALVQDESLELALGH